MNKIVDMRGISMKYHSKEGEVTAITNIDLSVDQGEFVSIVGPSGCGKSTLLSIMAGLIPPSSGQVLINGQPVAIGQQIGYMLQRDQLFPWRTILGNVLLGLEIQGKLTPENTAYAHELLEKYGLGEFKKHRPAELSGGMRQRAALIRTLTTRPNILLLDEPFSALDYQTRLAVSDEISAILAAEKVTAILVTHDISEAISLSDRVVVLSHRPATVHNIHHIDLGLTEKSPILARKSPIFSEYFNKIWKELDISG
ncbi:MAG: ABC transporter ATP-binding protein [Defluviitaleaceae bacterium]|nr:ABC transporter ATP-binding protein [Defluviitaleaceae bacterium]